MSGSEVVVIDIGSGYTKVGFAGNFDPTHIFPSNMLQIHNKNRNILNSMDVDIGVAQQTSTHGYECVEILSHGQIKDWDVYERYLSSLYYRKLNVDPSEHLALLTEAPMTPPETREKIAEFMFETLNVPGFYIGVQAVMALFASRISKKLSSSSSHSLTGVVIDSGAGVTHILPIIHGYVVSSCIQSLPLAGGDITRFISAMLKDRNENLPSDRAYLTAQEIKENYSYNCPNIVKEFSRFDDPKDPHGFKEHSFEHRGQKYTIDIGYEQFLAPELYFNPEFYGASYTSNLPELVDACVRKAPMTSRLELYGNIILSGGSTLFKGFDKRLQRDLNNIIKNKHNNKVAEAKVITHSKQKYAVWFGSSLLGKIPEFPSNVHTKEKYEEIGPRIARHNAVFFE